jgi:hypothetical protein
VNEDQAGAALTNVFKRLGYLPKPTVGGVLNVFQASVRIGFNGYLNASLKHKELVNGLPLDDVSDELDGLGA